MLSLFRKHTPADGLLTSTLYDQASFYKAFLHDLKNCTSELIIESPFITTKRVDFLLPGLEKLCKRGVNIVINTRDPEEHQGPYREQAYTAAHHRKLAIIDRHITWEGSLNILSHHDSCEIMRRIHSYQLTQQLINFLQAERYLAQEDYHDRFRTA